MYVFGTRCSGGNMPDSKWVSNGLTSHSTHYRSFRGRGPNQQCDSENLSCEQPFVNSNKWCCHWSFSCHCCIGIISWPPSVRSDNTVSVSNNQLIQTIAIYTDMPQPIQLNVFIIMVQCITATVQWPQTMWWPTQCIWEPYTSTHWQSAMRCSCEGERLYWQQKVKVKSKFI